MKKNLKQSYMKRTLNLLRQGSLLIMPLGMERSRLQGQTSIRLCRQCRGSVVEGL